MIIGNTIGNTIGEIYFDMSDDEKKEFKTDLLKNINNKIKDLEKIKKELELI